MFLQFLYCCNIRNEALSSLNVLIAIDSKQSITAHFRSHCAPPTAPVCICFHISAGVCCENTSLPLRMFSAFVPVVYCCDGTNDIWSTDECENSISAGLELFARSLWGNSGTIVYVTWASCLKSPPPVCYSGTMLGGGAFWSQWSVIGFYALPCTDVFNITQRCVFSTMFKPGHFDL